MNKIYKKDETTFAIIMIVIYVIGTILSETLTAIIGIAKLITAIFHVVFSTTVFIWIKKNGYEEKYGLSVPKYNPRIVWYFIPLIVVACSGIFFGIELQYSSMETVLFVISMACVGFLEEIIFRGFLFVGMAKENVKNAIIVSSLTFGIGHIVNLFSGKALFATILQIIFATVIGFTLVIIFHKGRSLLPCILFHSLNNCLSAFEKTNDEIAAVLQIDAKLFMILSGGLCILLVLVYAISMYKKDDFTKE